ncbi:hypothetical protein PV437_05390 [Streptomyces scabiei]|uniref:hypothetical protein n=1 Tax=Streptomyces scabiei TaxID=1930 RepID=UPI000AA50AF2|nr:hypothetical protein [Streptomyces scabiei]MDX2532590.1 hypothetical protein [Streptomyces scabiei]MDX3822899.1 hypothetical protein [Streptomyces scabiei]
MPTKRSTGTAMAVARAGVARSPAAATRPTRRSRRRITAAVGRMRGGTIQGARTASDGITIRATPGAIAARMVAGRSMNAMTNTSGAHSVTSSTRPVTRRPTLRGKLGVRNRVGIAAWVWESGLMTQT